STVRMRYSANNGCDLVRNREQIGVTLVQAPYHFLYLDNQRFDIESHDTTALDHDSAVDQHGVDRRAGLCENKLVNRIVKWDPPWRIEAVENKIGRKARRDGTEARMAQCGSSSRRRHPQGIACGHPACTVALASAVGRGNCPHCFVEHKIVVR